MYRFMARLRRILYTPTTTNPTKTHKPAIKTPSAMYSPDAMELVGGELVVDELVGDIDGPVMKVVTFTTLPSAVSMLTC